MADLFAPQQNTRTPKREAERLKTLAESLQKGGQSKGNEMVSGIVVKQSPLEHLARGLQTAAGGYFAGQAQNKAEEDERALQARIGEALGQWGDPQAAAGILAQDPRTSEMAFKLMMGGTEHERAKELMQMRIAASQSSGGGNMPAPMQIASQMFELEQAMNNPNLPEDQRFLAERQYNLLGQAAKTYGFDRGLGYGGSMDGYSNVYGGQQSMSGIPPVDMLPNGEMVAPMNGPTPNGPLTPDQYTTMAGNTQFNDLIGGLTGQPMQQDPVAAHAQAVAMQQKQTGVSPMQRPELSRPFTPPQIGEVPGYTDLMANRAATKAGAEEKAKMLAGPMPANIILEQNDLVEKTQLARGIENEMNKFSRQIESGALNLDVIGNIQNKVRNGLSVSTEESRNLASFEAGLEKLRNDSLRLNTGVQTDGDATRAWNELMANINDPAVVRQRLGEIAQINQRGAALQQQKLGLMRSEYGRGQIDIPNPYQSNTPPQKPQRDQIMQTLRSAGATEDEINAYLQARGL